MKALILYWTKTGNTHKVAEAIYTGVKTESVEVVIKMLEDAPKEVWFPVMCCKYCVECFSIYFSLFYLFQSFCVNSSVMLQ
jgi:flavorubredoxin